MKIKLAILESDTGYLKKIVTAFNTKYADKLEVYSFTNIDVAYQSLASTKISVFLASDSFVIDVERFPTSCGFAYLVDTGDIETVRDQAAICKFQKVELIYKRILNIFAENASDMTGFGLGSGAECRLVGFIAAAGGVGSSTAAAAYAVHLAGQNQRPLYLNLEQFGNSHMFFHAEGQGDFGEVIRAVKGKKKNMALKLESVLKRDGGVAFFEGAPLALDMGELDAEEICELLSELKAMGEFDAIILDLDFSLSEKAVNILGTCNHIIMVTDGSSVANEKTARALTSLEILEQQGNTSFMMKCSVLYNRFGMQNSCKLGNQEVRELGVISRYEGHMMQQLRQIAESSVFDAIY